MLPRTIVIDAGHGGSADRGSSTAFGARGPKGLLEKTVTLGLAERVARELGPAAMLTRNSDVNRSLAERLEVAARHGARAFVSLHANSAPGRHRGAEAWVHTRASAGSRMLATSLGRELVAVGGYPASVRRGELAVLSPERLAGHTAACLLEVDYLSDPDGEARLGDPRALDRVAKAIARGLRRFGDGEPAIATGIGDFWAVWCVNENCFLPEIFLSQYAAQQSAQRHMELLPEHRARAILVQMGNDLGVRAADAGTAPSAYGERDVNIQAIRGPEDFTLPDYHTSTGNIVVTVTPPPPIGTQTQIGQLSLLGTVTNRSNVAVEMRCSLLRQGSHEERTVVIAPSATQDFSFDFDNAERVQPYSFVLSLNTTDTSIQVTGSLTVMISDA